MFQSLLFLSPSSPSPLLPHTPNPDEYASSLVLRMFKLLASFPEFRSSLPPSPPPSSPTYFLFSRSHPTVQNEQDEIHIISIQTQKQKRKGKGSIQRRKREDSKESAQLLRQRRAKTRKHPGESKNYYVEAGRNTRERERGRGSINTKEPSVGRDACERRERERGREKTQRRRGEDRIKELVV